MRNPYIAQPERDGRRVAKFCKRRGPQTLPVLQAMLGVPTWRARRAVRWARQQWLTTENPFICEPRSPYRYGYRDQLVDVEDYVLVRLRDLHARLNNVDAQVEHLLVTMASVSATMGPADRQALNRWRRLLVTQVASTELIVGELENLLAP